MAPYEREIARWRGSRLARLTSPRGWLTLVGLEWLAEGANTIGSDRSNRVVLPSGPARIGVIDLRDGAATAQFDPVSGVTAGGEPVGELRLQDDAHGEPTLLDLGTLTFFVVSREGQLAVRIRDRDSAVRREFAGLEYYPVDRAWRIEARFEPHDPPKAMPVPTVLGRDETYRMPGALSFEIDGAGAQLEAFLETPATDLFIVFGDRTNGEETYGGGRYLHADFADDRGIVVLDFNKAYNPPCVFTPFATCALPLPENRLPIRVEAGEKSYRGPALPT
jgi:uncharacterized protein (DUF1684 family)